MTDDTYLILKMMILLLTIGAVGGFLSGLLGVGGGILFVPALFFCMTAIGFDEAHAMHIAIGTSLAVVLVTGGTSAFGHYHRGGVDMDRVRAWAPALVSGVLGGAFIAGIASTGMLKASFALITFFIAVYMFFARSPSLTPDKCPIVPGRVQRSLCAVIGTLSSMIGVGGAIMTVPFMSYMGMPIHRAVGTGAALGILISIPGTLGYMLMGLWHLDELPPYSVGYVNLLAVAMIIPASILLAPMGVQASYTLPRSILRRVFSVMLIIVSVRMFMTL